MPIANVVKMLPKSPPIIAAFQAPPLITTDSPPPAPTTNSMVRSAWACQATCRKCRRNTGNNPKTSIENRVREKTWVVEVSREARTVEAMRAAFVERVAGNLAMRSVSLQFYNLGANIRLMRNSLHSHASAIIEKEDIDAH